MAGSGPAKVVANGGVFRVGGSVTAPALPYKVEPEYSEEARKAKHQGIVVLYVEVDPSGRAQNLRVLQSLGLGLDEKAIEAVRKWKFRPGYKDGKPVTVAATVEVRSACSERSSLQGVPVRCDNNTVCKASTESHGTRTR